MATESTDKELVKRVQKGDKGAFDLLVLKYEQKIVNLVMRYVRDPEQALDITQEACSGSRTYRITRLTRSRLWTSPRRPSSRLTGRCHGSGVTARFIPGSTVSL